MWVNKSSFEVSKYFNHYSTFNGAFKRHNLSRIKDEAYVINFDDKQSKRTHWILLFIDRNTAVYIDSFGI